MTTTPARLIWSSNGSNAVILVGLRVHRDLPMHHAAGVLDRRDQMHRPPVAAPSTADTLAVDG